MDTTTGPSINQITEEIIGAAIRVHRALGPGLLESAYEACLCHELTLRGMRIERQKSIPIVYHDVKLDCGFRADLIVEDQVIVELKAKETLHPVDEAQVISYLKLTGLKVGLLLNFHVPMLKDGIKRFSN